MKKIFLLSFIFSVALESNSQTEISITEKMYGPNWFTGMESAKANANDVHYLDLTLLKLTTFPMKIITMFPDLKELYLGYNKFTTLPEELGNISTIEYLDLSGNYLLKTLPEGLKNLTQLKKLDIKDHKFMPETEIQKLRGWLPNCEIVSE